MKLRQFLMTTSTVLVLLILIALAAVPRISSQGPPATPELKGETAQDYLERGQIFANTIFDTAAALADLSQAIDLDPELTAAYIERGNIYHGVDAYNLARDDFANVLELAPDSEEGLLGRARYHTTIARQENFVQAQVDIDRVLELNPDSIDAIIAQGDLYRAQNLHDEAYEQFTMAVNSAPDNLVARERRLALGTLMSNTPPTVLTDLAAYLDMAEGTPALYQWSLYDLYRQNQTNRIMDACIEGLAEFPNDAILVNLCSNIAAGIGNNPELAAELVDRAIELVPESPRFHVSRGNHLRETLKAEEAIAEFEIALDLQPGYVPAINAVLGLYLYSPRSVDCEQAGIYVEMAHNSFPQTPFGESNLNNMDYDYSYRCSEEEAAYFVVDSPTYAVGSTVLVPGVVMHQLSDKPGALGNGPVCTSGSEATVLQSVTLEPDSAAVWVQLECDGGTGWTPEAFLQ